MKHGSVAPEIHERRARWNKYKKTTYPPIVLQAERWANAMDSLIKRNVKVEHIALKALQQACGKDMIKDLDRVQKLVEILENTWYLGPSLKRWAIRKGYYR